MMQNVWCGSEELPTWSLQPRVPEQMAWTIVLLKALRAFCEESASSGFFEPFLTGFSSPVLCVSAFSRLGQQGLVEP
jgi:hypothetical protein